MDDCFICDDIVSEWGEPVCRGCYSVQLKKNKKLSLEIEKLEKKILRLEQGRAISES